MTTRVLIVDDSPTIRQIERAVLARAGDITVVGEAADAYQARERIVELDPDVVTLDIEMPRMDGLTFLRLLMQHHPKPVVVISSLTPQGSAQALEALRLGAIEVLGKPGPAFGTAEYALRLVAAVRAAARARFVRHAAPVPPETALLPVACAGSVIGIGASTGGPEAVRILVSGLPPLAPPVMIVQHMPAGFTHGFAARLDQAGRYRVLEARGDEVLCPGTAYLAPGGCHLTVERADGMLVARLTDGPPEHFQRPAVDVLFRSLAATCGADAIGVLLTGMGVDGAAGLLAMRRAGAHTIAQDEASCAIFGMPQAAIERGAAAAVLPLPAIAGAILAHCVARNPARRG